MRYISILYHWYCKKLIDTMTNILDDVYLKKKKFTLDVLRYSTYFEKCFNTCVILLFTENTMNSVWILLNICNIFNCFFIDNRGGIVPHYASLNQWWAQDFN